MHLLLTAAATTPLIAKRPAQPTGPMAAAAPAALAATASAAIAAAAASVMATATADATPTVEPIATAVGTATPADVGLQPKNALVSMPPTTRPPSSVALLRRSQPSPPRMARKPFTTKPGETSDEPPCDCLRSNPSGCMGCSSTSSAIAQGASARVTSKSRSCPASTAVWSPSSSAECCIALREAVTSSGGMACNGSLKPRKSAMANLGITARPSQKIASQTTTTAFRGRQSIKSDSSHFWNIMSMHMPCSLRYWQKPGSETSMYVLHARMWR
mmetsp:Transcript_20178/g.55887  ORF Transcript_20178/g.55887 Transcript_20178/m.55887 type:complete len:273 (+) Transcript_20178:596-1414(+)